ncbi:hypothetical protein NBT05_17285 [Aquimarina sp. ERC-38]|uniref:hypothetical protein n=1 Tax=Aquimarina sp. ERC-38 TaxID=2949996 RepID=UPI00224531C4|nr:hypothetical protein [Aquimarina sp. ERC-38]UZO80682.1 hypothetical protein NBT05_17285 [Aquimarina sp. ERC-38]
MIVIAVILAITAYKRSFKMTMEAAQLVKESRSKLAKVSNSQQRILKLQKEVNYLDKLIGKEIKNPNIIQQEILNSVDQMVSQATILKLNKAHSAKDAYFTIYTNQLILTGSYSELLKTTYQLEKSFDVSRIVSLKLYTEKEPRTRKKKLIEQITFQNYEKL